MSPLWVTPLDIWVFASRQHVWSVLTLFLQTMWKGLCGLQCDTDNVIHTAANSCCPGISISIIEPSCCILGWLACNASAVCSPYEEGGSGGGVQLWQSRLSPETLWKAFLLKINPARPHPASQPCRPSRCLSARQPFPINPLQRSIYAETILRMCPGRRWGI